MGVMELSWHLYPLGKTAFTVFVAGALLLPRVPPRTRATWLLVAAAQVAMILAFRPGEVGGFWTNVAPTALAVAGLEVLKSLFVTRTLATPLLVVLGAASFLFLRKHRLFLLALLAVQFALIVTLALIHANELRPRRALVAEFYCVVAILAMLLEAGRDSARDRRARVGCIVLLVAGNVWQLYDMAAYMRIPVQTQQYPLPHTFSQADYNGADRGGGLVAHAASQGCGGGEAPAHLQLRRLSREHHRHGGGSGTAVHQPWPPEVRRVDLRLR
jgi:hypothetical protein